MIEAVLHEHQRELLLEQIQVAFRGVVLGNGVGLLEADALDDYADAGVLRDCRSRDERLDWTAIPPAVLLQHHSSPCFFDPEGMRFHLPAYLCAYLSRQSNDDFIFFLSRGNDSWFSLLNPVQEFVVREYLRWLEAGALETGIDFSLPLISEALRTSWV